MKPISEEKRIDIVRLKQKGKKESEIADWLDIRIGSVRKIWGQFVHTSIVPQRNIRVRKAQFQWKRMKKLLQKLANSQA